MEKNRAFCRRCLLEDMPSQAALAKSVRELVEMLPEEIKAPLEVIQNRLRTCRQCDHLLDGMCVLCGCYVELRAAKKKLKCPCVPGKWAE